MANALTIFHGELQKMEPQFERVLPAHLSVSRLTRCVENACRRNDKLLQANRGSLWDAAMSAAVLGIPPDGLLGQGFLVPFAGRVQFIPGYKGLIMLAFNSGYILRGHVVREADIYEVEYAPDEVIHHKPAINAGDGSENPIIGAYASGRHPTMPACFEHMDMAAIMAVMQDSKGYQAAQKYNKESPWQTNFAEMARKTPIRKLGGNMPMEVQKAVMLEQLFDRGHVANVVPNQDADGGIEIVDEAVDVTDVDAESGDAV